MMQIRQSLIEKKHKRALKQLTEYTDTLVDKKSDEYYDAWRFIAYIYVLSNNNDMALKIINKLFAQLNHSGRIYWRTRVIYALTLPVETRVVELETIIGKIKEYKLDVADVTIMYANCFSDHRKKLNVLLSGLIDSRQEKISEGHMRLLTKAAILADSLGDHTTHIQLLMELLTYERNSVVFGSILYRMAVSYGQLRNFDKKCRILEFLIINYTDINISLELYDVYGKIGEYMSQSHLMLTIRKYLLEHPEQKTILLPQLKPLCDRIENEICTQPPRFIDIDSVFNSEVATFCGDSPCKYTIAPLVQPKISNCQAIHSCLY